MNKFSNKLSSLIEVKKIIALQTAPYMLYYHRGDYI